MDQSSMHKSRCRMTSGMTDSPIRCGRWPSMTSRSRPTICWSRSTSSSWRQRRPSVLDAGQENRLDEAAEQQVAHRTEAPANERLLLFGVGSGEAERVLQRPDECIADIREMGEEPAPLSCIQGDEQCADCQDHRGQQRHRTDDSCGSTPVTVGIAGAHPGRLRYFRRLGHLGIPGGLGIPGNTDPLYARWRGDDRSLGRNLGNRQDCGGVEGRPFDSLRRFDFCGKFAGSGKPTSFWRLFSF